MALGPSDISIPARRVTKGTYVELLPCLPIRMTHSVMPNVVIDRGIELWKQRFALLKSC